MRRVLVLAAIGATVGTGLDLVHVLTRTTAYVYPAFWGLAWWVPFNFAAAALAIGLTHPPLDDFLGRSAPRPRNGAAIVAGIVALAAIWALSGLLKASPVTVGLVLAPASLAVWWLLDGTGSGLLLAAATAAAGVGVEVGLVRGGQFLYVHPDMAGVASWLPWLYVAASVSVGNLSRWLAAPGIARD